MKTKKKNKGISLKERSVDVRLEIPDLQNLIEKRFNDNLPVTEVKTWMPPSQESVNEVNKILKDVIEGKSEGNPFDLYSVTQRTKPLK
ncbi:hypothetical protein N1M2_7 [Klebsiella phage N1M2]|uniref:Uncharacterized protein n=1 Tax=Klebsiella phage N1M2 TaxID=2664939 RepID=A0A6B7ZEG7_9CAUD|nr:hypothetical protein PQB72_gp007 [Klebsiella phage N1M2]QGH71870.1 hypothetical protein N1M2_7 [Klebsiella phage N1M2]